MRLPSYERLRVIRLLLRFFRTSLQVGRMPSVMGEAAFRSRITGAPGRAFEDAVIFVRDVEHCLASLHPFDHRLIAICIFEDRSEWEAARYLRCNQAEISRRLGNALDLLHSTFCRLGLLPPLDEELCLTNETKAAPRQGGKRAIR